MSTDILAQPAAAAAADGFAGDGNFAAIDPRIRYFVNGAAVQNFGDYLPELLAQAFLLHPRIDADVYRLVGSVIDPAWIRRDLRRSVGIEDGVVAFWCCGLRKARPLPEPLRGKVRFCGVRGPLTRDVLGLPADTVLGDPGLLAPLMHRASGVADTLGHTVCIPHVQDGRDDAELLAISGAAMVLRPQIQASERALRRILDQIAAARFVLSASLHGAIVACAYGRPFAFWDNGHLDVPFKWQDFAASVGMPCDFARDVPRGASLYREAIAPLLRRPPLTAILDVCPFTVRPAALVAALRHDGLLDAGAGAGDVQRLLAALPSVQPQAVRALHVEAAARRAARRGIGFALRAGAGRGVEALKAGVRRVRGVS